MIHILVVDDDEKLNKTVCMYLNDCGFETMGVLNAQQAYDALYGNLFDLIISDIMMPQVDGFEFAHTVREVNHRIPILFMSAKDDLPSKQKGFRLGIDDYMVKPVELAELEMRVRVLLRRANIEAERKLTVGNLVMDADAMSAEIDGEEIPTTTREFNILYKLLSYPKKTFTRAQLMDEFWDMDSDTSLRAVDVSLRSSVTNSPSATDLKSKPFAAWVIRRCSNEKRNADGKHLPCLHFSVFAGYVAAHVRRSYRVDRRHESTDWDGTSCCKR